MKTRRIPIAIEALGAVPDALSQDRSDSDTIRIRASDLREAQQQTHRLRLLEEEVGRDPWALTVLVDVEVVLASVARDARRRQSLLPERVFSSDLPPTICYVGTPGGLANLLADIQAAGVADGATLIPLDIHESERLIAERVLPLLNS